MATTPVVACVDGSQESLVAAEWAAMEAQRHRAPLRIVSVPAMPPRMCANGSAPDTVAGRLRGESARALGEAIARSREVAPGQLVDADLLAGPPALAVTESGPGALMLVVGARGAGGFAALALGSVSRYAAMHAACPVVVVREAAGAVHREIVVGIGDPHEVGAALAFAFEEAALRGAALVAFHSLFHAAAHGHAGAWDGAERPGDAERIAAEAGKILSETLRTWREKYPEVRVRQDVVRDHPARVLASYSARADLVVVGRHGAAVAAPAIGGIQHALLNHARGPVAIVPAEA